MAHGRSKLLAYLAGMVFLCIVSASSQSNEGVLGARRYLQFCAACHGADGKGGDKATSLVTSRRVIDESDSELFRTVHDGTSEGMPPFAQIGDANIAAVVHYLRALQQDSTGTEAKQISEEDIREGKALFYGKGDCASCHMVSGQGGFIASNLTTYARNRKAAAILQAITAPDNPLIPSSRVVSVTMKSGQKITAVLRNEDSFSMELQSEDGRYYLLERSDVADIRYSDHSLMPRDYGTRLSTKELNDIVEFLIAAGRSPQTAGQSK